jgi:hypothetical protein
MLSRVQILKRPTGIDVKNLKVLNIKERILMHEIVIRIDEN